MKKGVRYYMGAHWINIVVSITVTLTVSIVLIKKKLFSRPISIFMVLFILGQVIGYGMNVDFFKVNIPHEDSGTAVSITSIAIPLALAFMIDYISRVFKRP